MRGLGGAAALALVAILRRGYQADAFATTACKSITDKDSTLMASLVSMGVVSESSLATLASDPAIVNLSATMPWFGACAAAINPMEIMMQGMQSTALAGCATALETTSTELASSNPTDVVFKYKICPLYNATVIPCILDGVVDMVQRAMNSSNDCCDELSAKIVEWTGNDLKKMASLLLQYIGNVLCSQKTITATNTTQYCGLALMNAIGGVDEATNPTSLIKIAQIPNSQVCSALAGSPFTNTLGVSSSLPISGSNDIGICFKPLDRLLQHVRDYPLVQSYAMVMDDGKKVAMTDLFSNGTCVPGNAIFEWLANPASLVMAFLGAMDAFMSSFDSSQLASEQTSTSASASSSSGSGTATPTYSPSFENTKNLTTELSTILLSLRDATKSLCFHLPNSASCSYSGQTIAYAYPAVSGSTPTGVALPTQSGAADSASKLPVALALLVTIVAALAAGLVARQ